MSNRTRFSISTAVMALILSGAAAPRAQASGFQLREQSASSLGNAFAGASAGGFDISSMYWNPAAMSFFEGSQFSGAGSFIGLTMKLDDSVGTRSGYFEPGQRPISGPTGYPNAVSNPLLPAMYATWAATPDLKVGVSVNVPFGLATNYDDNFVGRYHALKTDMQIIDVSPSIAYQVSPGVSLGATAVARHTKAEMSNAVDFGGIAAAKSIPGYTAGSADGKAVLTGQTWTFGFKLGAAFRPTESLRIGLGYQGAMTLKVDGNVAFSNVPALLAPTFASGGGKADVKLPDTASLGFVYDVSKEFSVQGEVARTGWAKFDELRVRFATGVPTPPPDSVVNESWKDTWYYALGFNWKLDGAWTIRAGAAFDQSPVDDAHRTPRIPDGDRTWFSLGASYEYSKRTTIDVGYTHIIAPDSYLNLSAGTNPSGDNFFRGTLTGKYKIGANILAVGMRYKF